MKPLFLALLLLIPVIASGQQTAASDLPTYGTMDSIKQHRRVYVASDNDDSRERIIKALGKDKSLVVVNSPDEAQFFIQYEDQINS